MFKTFTFCIFIIYFSLTSCTVVFVTKDFEENQHQVQPPVVIHPPPHHPHPPRPPHPPEPPRPRPPVPRPVDEKKETIKPEREKQSKRPSNPLRPERPMRTAPKEQPSHVGHEKKKPANNRQKAIKR